MKRGWFWLIVPVAGVLVIPATAFGHPGHGTDGFSAGAMHPLSGVDHLLAMLAIGVWTAQLGRRTAWLIPAAFVIFMIAGAALALTGLQIGGTAVDQAIAVSLLITGLLIAGAWRMGIWSGAALAALFAMFHGYAHGAEMHTGAAMASYSAGLVCTTAFLLAAGCATAMLLTRMKQPVAIRLAGASVAAIAAVLLGGLL